MEVPQTIKNRTAVGPSDSTSGCLSEKHRNTTSDRYMATTAVLAMTKLGEQLKCTPIDEQRSRSPIHSGV